MEILLGGQFFRFVFWLCWPWRKSFGVFKVLRYLPPWSQHLTPCLSPIKTYAKKNQKFLLHVPQDTENHQPTSSSSTNNQQALPTTPPSPWAFVKIPSARSNGRWMIFYSVWINGSKCPGAVGSAAGNVVDPFVGFFWLAVVVGGLGPWVGWLSKCFKLLGWPMAWGGWWKWLRFLFFGVTFECFVCVLFFFEEINWKIEHYC